MSVEQRDEWGETAEERHARILARDLAWMTYAEACARDGVPRSERDHLIFNDGYAAGRADYLPSAPVVAEDPVREHTYKAPNGCDDDYAGLPTFDLETAREVARNFPHEGELLERRPATPWVPVKQEGVET